MQRRCDTNRLFAVPYKIGQKLATLTSRKVAELATQSPVQIVILAGHLVGIIFYKVHVC